MQLTTADLAEFKSILLRDYDYMADDKTALELANNFLTSLEAILVKRQLTKIPERRKSDS